jgi:hypothetical protein
MKRSELKAKAAQSTKVVEWSEEDRCFVGSAPPIIGPCCHGNDETRVYRCKMEFDHGRVLPYIVCIVWQPSRYHCEWLKT